MKLHSLIKRLHTAAARGYSVARASKYAAMLGGKGSETSAKELLALALKKHNISEDDVPAMEEPAMEEPPVEEPDMEEPAEEALPEEDSVEAETVPEEAMAPEGEAQKPLDQMSKEELMVIAREMELPGRSTMDKTELLESLKEALK